MTLLSNQVISPNWHHHTRGKILTSSIITFHQTWFLSNIGFASSFWLPKIELKAAKKSTCKERDRDDIAMPGNLVCTARENLLAILKRRTGWVDGWMGRKGSPWISTHPNRINETSQVGRNEWTPLKRGARIQLKTQRNAEEKELFD